MSSKRSKSQPFKVVIYESELRQIQAWTEKVQHQETGGDLFGLWLDENTAVVQLVLGPGKNCRRTSWSFYQDVSYLERVGNHLTDKEGLCHIGEWHSHHTLGLTNPSGGDKNTWSNMHRYGIHRFILFIATFSLISTLKKKNSVNVDAYLFRRNEQHRHLPILHSSSESFEKIDNKSPFRIPRELNMQIKNGAESWNSENDVKKFENDKRPSSDQNDKIDQTKSANKLSKTTSTSGTTQQQQSSIPSESKRHNASIEVSKMTNSSKDTAKTNESSNAYAKDGSSDKSKFSSSQKNYESQDIEKCQDETNKNTEVIRNTAKTESSPGNKTPLTSGNTASSKLEKPRSVIVNVNPEDDKKVQKNRCFKCI